MQTPFYEKGFWSLLLHSVTDSDAPDSSSKTSGVIQVDGVTDFSLLFGGVHRLAKEYGRHPMLLPLQLFITHCHTTTGTFQSIFEKVADVDRKLMKELKTKSKADKASELYRALSMTLHESSMELAELDRRRQLEADLGERLMQELQNERKLKEVASIFAGISKSRDFDIESLPGKIESQRNVVGVDVPVDP